MSLLCSEAMNDSLMPTGWSTDASTLYLPSSMIYTKELIVQEPKNTRLSAATPVAPAPKKRYVDVLNLSLRTWPYLEKGPLQIEPS